VPELLPFICQTEGFFQHAVGTSAGSLSPRTNWESLAAFEFQLPSVDEQRRIATALQAIEQTSESVRRLTASAAVVERALVDNFVFETKDPVVELGPLLVEPPRNGYSAIEASSPTGHWVLALSALTWSGYRRGQLKAVVRSAAVEASTLTPGDLLISRSNTRELVGLAGTFDEDRADVSWPDTMMRLRPDSSRLKPAFLEYLLRSTSGRQQIQSFAAGTSASMKKINSEHVKKLRFPVPSLSSQDAVIRRVTQVRNARRDAESRLGDVSSLKRACFKSAFADV
jgi:type I restriction enzyme S subunit